MDKGVTTRWLSEPKSCALIVVDVQNDFVHPSGHLAMRGTDVSRFIDAIDVINQSVDLCHRVGTPVVYVRETISEETVMDNYLDRCGGFEQCPVRRGTWGWDWYEGLTSPGSSDVVVEKPCYDAFHSSVLDRVLKRAEVRTCIFEGFASNVCVEATAIHGYELGYNCALVTDGSQGDSEQGHQAVIDKWADYYGDVLDFAALSDALSRVAWNDSRE